jgi:hypothetical protein
MPTLWNSRFSTEPHVLWHSCHYAVVLCWVFSTLRNNRFEYTRFCHSKYISLDGYSLVEVQGLVSRSTCLSRLNWTWEFPMSKKCILPCSPSKTVFFVDYLGTATRQMSYPQISDALIRSGARASELLVTKTRKQKRGNCHRRNTYPTL